MQAVNAHVRRTWTITVGEPPYTATWPDYARMFELTEPIAAVHRAYMIDGGKTLWPAWDESYIFPIWPWIKWCIENDSFIPLDEEGCVRIAFDVRGGYIDALRFRKGANLTQEPLCIVRVAGRVALAQRSQHAPNSDEIFRVFKDAAAWRGLAPDPIPEPTEPFARKECEILFVQQIRRVRAQGPKRGKDKMRARAS